MAALRRLKLGFFATAFVALLGAVLWQVSPLPALLAVSSLSDPAKLATLGKRGANPRLNKVVFWLNEAQERHLPPATAIRLAQVLNGTSAPRAPLVADSLLRNLQIAGELGLWTPENRERLRRGQGGIVTRGPYSGETVEVDHIVPVSLAPEVGNELANLELLPRTLNRKKLDHVGPRQLALAERFAAAGLLPPASLERVRQAGAPRSAPAR